MLVQIFEKQEEMNAKKEYKNNIGKINDLEDICQVIDELIERIDDVNCDFKDKFIQNLKDIKFDIVAEMRGYEEENFEILEVWEEECEAW